MACLKAVVLRMSILDRPSERTGRQRRTRGNDCFPNQSRQHHATLVFTCGLSARSRWRFRRSRQHLAVPVCRRREWWRCISARVSRVRGTHHSPAPDGRIRNRPTRWQKRDGERTQRRNGGRRLGLVDDDRLGRNDRRVFRHELLQRHRRLVCCLCTGVPSRRLRSNGRERQPRLFWHPARRRRANGTLAYCVRRRRHRCRCTGPAQGYRGCGKVPDAPFFPDAARGRRVRLATWRDWPWTELSVWLQVRGYQRRRRHGSGWASFLLQSASARRP